MITQEQIFRFQPDWDVFIESRVISLNFSHDHGDFRIFDLLVGFDLDFYFWVHIRYGSQKYFSWDHLGLIERIKRTESLKC